MVSVYGFVGCPVGIGWTGGSSLSGVKSKGKKQALREKLILDLGVSSSVMEPRRPEYNPIFLLLHLPFSPLSPDLLVRITTEKK